MGFDLTLSLQAIRLVARAPVDEFVEARQLSLSQREIWTFLPRSSQLIFSVRHLIFQPMKLYVLLLSVGLSISAQAQTSLNIESSRPGVAIGSNVVGTSIFQIESGVQRLQQQGSKELVQDTLVTELRYGLSEALEFTSEFDLEKKGSKGRPDASGVSDVELGLKYSFNATSEGWMPALSARARLKVPGGHGPEFQKNPAPNLIVSSAWDLSDTIELEADAGVSADPDKGSSKSFFALFVQTEVTDKLNLFIEGFHSFEDGTGSVAFDAGVGYRLTSHFQVDAFAGSGLGGDSNQTLFGAGVSWRLP